MAKYFIAIFISFLIGYLGYDYGVNKTKSYYVQLQKESLSKLNNQLVLLQEQNQELNKRIVLNSLEKEREIYNINKRHSSIISSLQQRPERTNSITEQSPSVTTANSPRAGSTGEQLYREDAKFLIGEATKAMILQQSLLDCRRNYNTVYEAVPIRNAQ